MVLDCVSVVIPVISEIPTLCLDRLDRTPLASLLELNEADGPQDTTIRQVHCISIPQLR